MNATLLKLKQINTGVPQNAFLSKRSFNIYTSEILLPPNDLQITTYADDITIIASPTKHHRTQQLIKPYLHKIYKWATTHNFYMNTDKTITTLFTLEPVKCSTT